MNAPVLFSLLAAIPATAPPIVIDGEFEDWRDIPVTIEDPLDAPDAVLDLGELRLAHDDRFLHLLIDVTRPVNVQRLPGRIAILFDTDGDAGTGRTAHDMPGVEFIVELSPPDPDNPNRAGRGAAIVFPPGRARMSPYLVGLKIAPTHASDTFEMRLDRDARVGSERPVFNAPLFRCRVVYLDRGGEVVDETKVFVYELSPVDPVPPPPPIDPAERPDGTLLRVVTWNTGMDGLRRNPDVYERLLSVIDPDVIFFQELTEDDDPAELAGSLRRWMSEAERGRWTVLRGVGGGRLRCAVASRRPLQRYAPMDPLPMPDRPARSVRVMGAELSVSGRTLLVASVHLRCCGFAGSFEDRTRIIEADAIRRAIDTAVASGRFDGVIVGGDLNLVGSRWPLEVLGENLDVVDPLQLDGRSNTTWSDIRQPFVPGRLDFVLVSGASPSVRQAFILDTRLVDPHVLRRYDLRVRDTVDASDHMPLIIDLGGVAGRR